MNQGKKQIIINDCQISMGGVSEIGVDKKVNQDAYKIGADPEKQLAYIIVADGLGSSKFSDKGSATIADIIEKWILEKLPGYAFLSDNVVNIMVKRIVSEWNAAYDLNEIYDYDSTVHIAVFYKGSILVGGIGDGMALLSYDQLVCKDHIDEKNLFSNVTNSMCSMNVMELMDFEIIPADFFKDKAIVILATDGIADDLIPEKKLTLLDYFQEVLRNGGINKLQTELEEWISDWETENHSDDKTLCYLAIKKGVVQ